MGGCFAGHKPPGSCAWVSPTAGLMRRPGQCRAADQNVAGAGHLAALGIAPRHRKSRRRRRPWRCPPPRCPSTAAPSAPPRSRCPHLVQAQQERRAGAGGCKIPAARQTAPLESGGGQGCQLHTMTGPGGRPGCRPRLTRHLEVGMQCGGELKRRVSCVTHLQHLLQGAAGQQRHLRGLQDSGGAADGVPLLLLLHY